MSISKSLRCAAGRHMVAGVILFSTVSAFATAPLSTSLLSEQPLAVKEVLPKHALKGKSRAVKINHRQLRNGRFLVSLPGGVSYEAVRELHVDMGKERSSWIGHASDDPDNRVVIGISGEAVAATFAYHGKLFKLEPRADGGHVVSEVRNTEPGPELDPIPVADASSTRSTSEAVTTVTNSSNSPVIDVLVAYTPAVQAVYGIQGTDALIIQAVAEANQAYANSKMTTRLNLVRSVRTNYVESGDISSDLSRLRATSDGYMDELHALRNSYGADVVNLIANEPLSCGIAYRMATLSSSFAASAFSVVHHSCATGYFSFAHEIGHNQGAHHDAANASGAAIFPYAYGYQDPYGRFRSIMAYDCPGGCPRGAGFSHGDNPFWGLPTGDPDHASNARAIDETAPTVAAFRQAVVSPPAAPSNLNSTESGSTFLSLTWTDNALNESGYFVERSADGFNFSQIASLPSNSVSYVDDNLLENTNYYYRVRAWNSGAFSSFSNIAAVTTTSTPRYIDQFIETELSAGGIITGTFEDTRDVDGVTETIAEMPSWNASHYGYLEHYWVIQVMPGKSITLNANVSTDSPTQSFTFAFATAAVVLSDDPAAWTDMFTVSAQNPGNKQFTLPATLTGPVYISVRDSERVPQKITSDSINIDHLVIKTQTE